MVNKCTKSSDSHKDQITFFRLNSHFKPKFTSNKLLWHSIEFSVKLKLEFSVKLKLECKFKMYKTRFNFKS